MKQRNRTYNSILNLIVGLLSRFITIVFGFAVRAIFIKFLSEDYLGANGLYSNILSMLSLTELGFSTAIVYSMYRPFAKKDYGKIAQLLILYKKVYISVGITIMVLGLSIIPFMGFFIKDKPNIDNLELYYILYLMDTVISYCFFAYHQSILQANQKAYIISGYYSLFSFIKDIAQIITLIIFRSYLIYLIVQISCKIFENICIKAKAKKEYPQIYKNKVGPLAKKEQNKIFYDVKALVLNKFSHVILNCTDNIIISAVVGLRWVGLLSNYVLITSVVSGVLSQVTAAVQASLGNFFAKKNSEEGYLLFRRIDFITFWIYGFSATALIVLLNPFISLWIGDKYTLSLCVITTIVLNFLIAGFLNTTWTFRSTLGLFTQGKYRPFASAILNVILSVLMGIKWGVFGVLIATTISRLLFTVWYDPWVIHKYGFNKSVKPYYWYSLKRMVLLLFTIFFTYSFSRMFIFNGEINFVRFIIGTGFTALAPNIIFLIAFRKKEELKYFVGAAKFLKDRILNKVGIIKK